MEQPIAEMAARAAPFVLIAAAAVAVYLALLSAAYAEARLRVRGYERLRWLVEGLERHGPPGAPRSPRVAAARLRLEHVRETLVRDGILPAPR